MLTWQCIKSLLLTAWLDSALLVGSLVSLLPIIAASWQVDRFVWCGLAIVFLNQSLFMIVYCSSLPFFSLRFHISIDASAYRVAVLSVHLAGSLLWTVFLLLTIQTNRAFQLQETATHHCMIYLSSLERRKDFWFCCHLVSKVVLHNMRNIWHFQSRLVNKITKKILKLIRNPKHK